MSSTTRSPITHRTNADPMVELSLVYAADPFSQSGGNQPVGA
jgi:hypothetical protein